MLREALTYPARTDEETLLVGSILLVAVGLLVRLGVLAVLSAVPVVVLVGYALAVLRTSAEGEDSPPDFAGFRLLAADGVRSVVVGVGYLLVPGVALAGTVGGAVGAGGAVGFGGASAGARPATFETTAFVFGAGTVVLSVSLAFSYLLPAALVVVSRTRNLRSATEFGRLRRTVTDGRYFLGWVAGLLVVGVAGLVVGSLVVLGRPGEVLALAIGFYAVVVVARLLGRAAR